uniref:Profilin n=2 Tax=Kalanchoe fedtschenkoi TaxID=63787 RepID=A0A7N0TZ22_KALFE
MRTGWLGLMDWGLVHKAWEKWASASVGSSGQPLKAALLINYEPGGPSRLLPIIAEQEGLKLAPPDLTQFVAFVKRKQFQSETFFVADSEYLVTSIHESWFSARSMNSSKPAGEGAIVMQAAAFLLIGLYDGSVDSASRAMLAVDQFAWQIGRRNL